MITQNSNASIRAQIIDGLNEQLDADHDLVVDVLTSDYDLSLNSPLRDSELSHDSGGVRVANGLSIIAAAIDGVPIVPVFENGIIQYFE